MSRNFPDPTLALHIRAPQSDRIFGWAANAAAEFRAWLVLARTRKVVRELDARQLADAGIDASSILPARPTIAIERGLMNRLMTMP
ncbi:MAG TPA: DUF1127 domain-containing protein [Burkholderiaceae bacterium]|nr:DUF1127 domain-containing protein [Burkholderiaceae bacterium]